MRSIIQCLPFSVWLISLGIMSFRSIRVVASGRMSFSGPDSVLLCLCAHTHVCACVYTHGPHLLPSFLHGRTLRRPPYAAAARHAASTRSAGTSEVLLALSSRMRSEVEWRDLFLIQGEILCRFPHWPNPFTFPPAACLGSFFSTSSQTLTLSCLVDNSRFNRYEVISRCGFDLN